ncbi:MAG TPA: hypothetical protein VFG68_19960 [Fimbriiglobus sp.]|nr:hypothetical protein [Fimbriiglobus sp.]
MVAAVTAEPRTVRLSESVRVTLSVEGPAPLRVEVPDEVLDGESAAAWRSRPAGPATVTDMPGGRQRWVRSYRLDPYLYLEGKPLHLGFAPARAFVDKDPQPKEVVWKPVEVTVTTEVTAATEPRPTTGIEELPPADGAADSLRDRIAVLAALGVAVVLVGVVGAWLLRRRRRVPPPSPEEWAIARLDELAPGDPAFADRLSDVLRTYLERRSGLPATRRTTAELLTAIGSDGLPVELVRPVLERCDAAKFAGLDPTADECRQLLAAVRSIVTLPSKQT